MAAKAAGNESVEQGAMTKADNGKQRNNQPRMGEAKVGGGGGGNGNSNGSGGGGGGR